MSLADLKPGTFRTTSLNAMIRRELRGLESLARADEQHGRLLQAKKKRWLAEAVTEYMRLTDNELNGTRNYLKAIGK